MKQKFKKEVKIASAIDNEFYTIKEIPAEGVTPPEVITQVQEKIGKVIEANLKMLEIIRVAGITVPAEVNKFAPFYKEVELLAANNNVDFDLINQQLVLGHCSVLAAIIEAEERRVLSEAASAVFGVRVLINKEHFSILVRAILADEESTQSMCVYDLPTVLKDLFTDVIKSRRIRYGSF